MSAIPRRLIVCVDGTWFDPDGGASKKGNITNVYRLFSSVKKGVCISKDGKRYIQDPLYIPGIGSEDNISKLEKYYTGAFGLKCFDQIKEIYRRCCHLSNPGDEVWLYGFSRGAYVVRAVAGLLHYVRALASADSNGDNTFESDYKDMMKRYQEMQKSSGLNEGRIHSHLTAKTREAPIIRFVGAFDTVKAVDDKSLYDITFNDSIQHMRAALALNEERRAMRPEGVWPSWGSQTNSLKARSFVQAWFVGAHMDIGGSAEKDGLALYPLQWMIMESQAKGLHFEFTGTYGGRAPLQNPLELIGLVGSDRPTWSCTTENNMTVEMRDIRYVHNNSLFGKGYAIELNRARGALAKAVKTRKPFEGDGKLRGYCSFAPQGTIIHPSVYLVMDQELNKSINKRLFPFHSQLEECREKMLGLQRGITEDRILNQGFWNEREEVLPEEMPAIRVLVCGNSGVGKSKLINEIFGVERTVSSDNTPGQHNVNDEIKCDDRPDLIIHDSRGFEAAGVDEFNELEKFLEKRSKVAELSERVHIIWVCAEANDCRLTQTSTQKLFKSISKYAEGIPVIVVATKMDEFLAIAEAEAKRKFRKEKIKYTEDDLEIDAQRQLTDTLSRIEEQLNGIGGRFDACIATSMYDPESIDKLNVATRESFTSETVRFLYVRAQQRDIDSKVDYAIVRTMKIYKHILGSATSTAGVPGAPTSTRAAASIKICQTIIACFGLSTVSADTALEIYKSIFWDDLPDTIMVAIAEGFSTMGIMATILTGGLPVFLAPMAVNIPSVVKATMRLTLMLACDMILIMNTAFKDASMKCIGKPEKRDVEVAARAYRDHFKSVHNDVKKLIPGCVRAFQVGKVDVGFSKIICEHKTKVEQSSSYRPGKFDHPHRMSLDPTRSFDSSTTVAADDEDDIEKLLEGNEKYKELVKNHK